MTHQPYTPNERIIDRAITLWKRALEAPIYRNEPLGAATSQNLMAGVMATMIPKNNTPDVLDAFGRELKDSLMRQHQGERNPDYLFYERSLCVDYDPCTLLAKAATTAGLRMQFPWKTYMDIQQDCLSFSMGYGAETIYHYPLANDRWLLTSLRGGDISKVIAAVDGGELKLLVE